MDANRLLKYAPGLILAKRHMSKGISRHFFASGFHVLDNFFHARAFSKKDIDIAVLVHDGLEAFSLFGKIKVEFRNPNGVNVATYFMVEVKPSTNVFLASRSR